MRDRRPAAYRDAALALLLCLFLFSPQTPTAQFDERRRNGDVLETNDSNVDEWNSASTSVSQYSTMGNYSSVPIEEFGAPVVEAEAEAEALGASGNDPLLANKEDVIGTKIPEAEGEAEAAALAEAARKQTGATAYDDDAPEAEPESEQVAQAEEESRAILDDPVLGASSDMPLALSEAEPEMSLGTLLDPVIVCMRMAKPFVFRIECEIDEIIYPPATLALEEFRLHFQGLDVDLLQALKA